MAPCSRGRRTQHHPCHFARRPSRRLQRAHRRGDVALDSIACDRRCQTTAWNRRGHFAVLVTRQRVNWIFCRSKTEAARCRRGRNADDFERGSDAAGWHVGSGQHDRVFAVLRRAQTHFCDGRSGHPFRTSRRRRCSRASTFSGGHQTDPVPRDISKRPEQFVLRHLTGFSWQKTHRDVRFRQCHLFPRSPALHAGQHTDGAAVRSQEADNHWISPSARRRRPSVAWFTTGIRCVLGIADRQNRVPVARRRLQRPVDRAVELGGESYGAMSLSR